MGIPSISGFLSISSFSNSSGFPIPSVIGLGQGSEAVAVRVVAASPEFAPLLLPFLLHTPEHRFAAFGAKRGPAFCSLLLTGLQPFGCHVLSEAACLAETVKSVLYLRM